MPDQAREGGSGRVERLIKAGPPPPSPARLPACAQAEDMWKLKVPSGGGKDGRTDGGEASFCMARAANDTGQKAGGGGGGGAGRLP